MARGGEEIRKKLFISWYLLVKCRTLRKKLGRYKMKKSRGWGEKERKRKGVNHKNGGNTAESQILLKNDSLPGKGGSRDQFRK